MYIVKLEEKCWLAPSKGDPDRTCVEINAKRFLTEKAASYALKEAQKIRPYKFGKVVKTN